MNTMRRKDIGAGSAGEYGTQSAALGCARFIKVFFLSISLIGLGAWGGDTYAVACTSDSSGNWAQKGTWGTNATGCVGAPGGIPGAADDVIIAVGHTVTMNDNPGSAQSLIINGTADWANARTTNIGAGGITINAGGNITGAAAGVLTSTGGLTINANLTSTTVTVRLQTTAAQTISGTGSLANLLIDAGVTATNTGTLTVGTALSGTGTLSNTGTLNLGGTSAITTLTASAIGNTVNYTGAAQTVKVPSGAPATYYNLTLSGSGIKTMPATAMTVAGNFSLSGTATATAAAALTVGSNFTIGAGTTFNAGAFNHIVSGNWSSAGTFNAGTGTVTLNGTAAQTISGTNPVSFNNLTVTNAASPNITLATNVTVAGTLTGTVTLTNTCPIDWTLTSTTPAQVLHSCPGPDHILITHAGSALTCSPQIVTITACGNALCTLPHYSGGANVTLTPGGQIFAIDATGINNAATVQQSTAGAVVLDATSVPAAINITTCWNSATSTASCTMTFNDSGFLVTVPDHVSCNNATVTIEAVETAPGTGRCVPAYQNLTGRPVNLYSSYTNPATGTQVVTASTGVVSTSSPGTAHSLDFDATGTATITLSYPDAGQLTLTANDTAPTTAAMTGSDTFVVAPASFVFSGIPAAPLTAGQPFNATVTAMNACGIPAATPNFDGTVTITSSNPQPGIGNATAINTTLSGFSNGVASINLTWDEVGTIDLNANLANYLGSALAISGMQAGAGRFHPTYFDTVVTQGCGTFTYAGSTAPVKAGQPFTVTVTANKTGGGITANYAGAANAYLTTLSNAGVTAGFANNTIAAASFANGVGSANVTYEVATPQTALLTLTLRATDSDTPAVSSSGYTEGTTEIRSGRAKISNAHGSELLALPIPFRAEYWNNGWVLNPADICSGDGLLGGTVSVALSALPATCVQDTGSPGLSGAGCAAAGPAGQRFKEGGIAGFAGNFNLWLKAPGAGNTGAVTVTGNVPAWLQYPWSGGAAINPAARATFGVYKGGDEFIYQRENY